MLVGVIGVRPFGTGHLLEAAFAVKSQGDKLAEYTEGVVCCRLIDPGSEFRFHREWYLRSARGDLLGEDYSLAQMDKPYQCLDLLLEHRDELFGFLKGQWGKLFGAKDV